MVQPSILVTLQWQGFKDFNIRALNAILTPYRHLLEMFPLYKIYWTFQRIAQYRSHWLVQLPRQIEACLQNAAWSRIRITDVSFLARNVSLSFGRFLSNNPKKGHKYIWKPYILAEYRHSKAINLPNRVYMDLNNKYQILSYTICQHNWLYRRMNTNQL